MTNVYDGPGDEDELYEDEEDLGPGAADRDLSEVHGYEMWDSSDQDDTSVIPQWAMVAVTIVVVIALVLPAVLLIWRFG